MSYAKKIKRDPDQISEETSLQRVQDNIEEGHRYKTTHIAAKVDREQQENKKVSNEDDKKDEPALSDDDVQTLLIKLAKFVAEEKKHVKVVERIKQILQKGAIKPKFSGLWGELIKSAYSFWHKTICDSFHLQFNSILDYDSREVNMQHLPRMLSVVSDNTKSILRASCLLFEEISLHPELIPKIERPIVPEAIFDQNENEDEAKPEKSLFSLYAAMIAEVISSTSILLSPDSIELGKGTQIIRDRLERLAASVALARLRKAKANEIIEERKLADITEYKPFLVDPFETIPDFTRIALMNSLYCVGLITRDVIRSIWSKNEAITFYSSMLLTKDGLLEQEKEQILVWINEIKSGNTGTGGLIAYFGRRTHSVRRDDNTFARDECRWRNADIAKGKNTI